MSTVPPSVQTEATSSRPRDPSSVQPGVLPSVGPSGTSTVPVVQSVRVEVREPSIPLPAVPVPELSSDDEPIALRRRGKRPVTVDPEEVPLRICPHTSEPRMSKDHYVMTLKILSEFPRSHNQGVCQFFNFVVIQF